MTVYGCIFTLFYHRVHAENRHFALFYDESRE